MISSPVKSMRRMFALAAIAAALACFPAAAQIPAADAFGKKRAANVYSSSQGVTPNSSSEDLSAPPASLMQPSVETPSLESYPEKSGSTASSTPAVLGQPVAQARLDDVDPDTLGLLGAEAGGLGASMWEGTPRMLVDRLLPQLSLPTASPVLNGLIRRLLLSTAAVPEGGTQGKTNLTSIRLEKLLALGQVEDAWKLAMLAKPGRVDEITMRLVTEAALIGPDSKDICGRMPEIMAGHNGVEWQKDLVLCQLRAGDTTAAQLGLDLMREQQVKDDLFLSLINRNVLGGSKRLPQQLTPLRPNTLAVLRQLDLPLPRELYGRPDASLIPELLQSKAEDDKDRIALAERAAAQDLIDAAQLAAVYQSVTFDSKELASVLNGGEKDNPRLRAALYQAAANEQSLPQRLDLIGKFVQASDIPSLNGAAGVMLADLVFSVPVTTDYNVHAAGGAGLFALAGQPDRALAWLNLARGTASSMTTVAEQLQAFWPVYVLAGLVTDREYGQGMKAWLDYMMQKKAAQFANEREGREHVGAVLLLFSAAGFAVPEEAWLRVADVTADGRRMAVPSPILMERLRLAGAAKRKGETVLLSALLAGGGVKEVPLYVVTDTVKALRQAGLMAEALAFAREAATELLTSGGNNP